MPVRHATMWQRLELRILLAAMRVMLSGLVSGPAGVARVPR